MKTQTFYLSFCDAAKPKGSQFLGAVVVDVTEADMCAAMPKLQQIRAFHDAAPADEASWLAGAIHKAHDTGCNPGGEVGSFRIDRAAAFAQYGPLYPRNRLLSKADIEAIDEAIEERSTPGAEP